MICKGYSTITVERGSQLLGMTPEQLCECMFKWFKLQSYTKILFIFIDLSSKQWKQEGNIFHVEPIQSPHEQSINLDNLTRYLVFLES